MLYKTGAQPTQASIL